MVNKQIIILKESELIELIKSSVKELQNEQFITFAVNPIYISSSPITVAATMGRTTSLGSNSGISWANLLGMARNLPGNLARGSVNMARYAFKGPGGANPLGAMAIGPCSGLENGQPVDPDGCASLMGVANYFYEFFIECEGWNECTRRGLDAIAIITAFIPGVGQIISIVAGVTSGLMAIGDGEYGEATFSLVFELFPITRMIKRSGAVNVSLKEMDNVFKALSKKELTQETLEQFSKELTQKELKFIKQLANQDLKVLNREINQAINNPANKKMIDDLLSLRWDDVNQLSGLKITQQQFKELQQSLITQLKQTGMYDDIMKNLNLFKKELKFIGVGLGTALVSQIMVQLGMSYFVDELTTEQQLELEALTGFNIEDVIEEAKRSPEFWECCFNNVIEALLEGCSPAFITWLKATWYDSKNMTNEELWDRWTKDRDEEAMKKDLEFIFDKYWKPLKQTECRKEAWEKVKKCRKGINSLIDNLK